MRSEQNLQWVQQNRHHDVPARLAGQSVVRLVQRLAGDADTVSDAVMTAIDEVVDETFRAHCRIVVNERREVVINVDVPAMVYSMRAEWLNPLRQALSRGRARSMANRVRFAFGTHGASLGGWLHRPTASDETRKLPNDRRTPASEFC